MKVFFGTAIIQKSRRIALDPSLLENLELGEGDRVRVYLETDTQSLVIEKDAAKEVQRKAPRRGRNS